KNFKFPKQHFLVHALDDVRTKGVLRNGTTRTGEGTHREVKQHYRQTNMRNAEAQIAVRDEDKEVVAQTRLIIDDFFKVNSHIDSQSGLNTSDESDAEKKTAELTHDSNQWIFGSPLQYGDSRSYEDLYGGNNPVYRELDPRLRDFLHNQFPEESVAYEDNIAAMLQCVYVSYQSTDDWTNAEDILVQDRPAVRLCLRDRGSHARVCAP
ncbi:hypothetical protein R3P38DRAFT_2557403, partial [Favolaschia claudopus]